MTGAKITALGCYVPPGLLTNQDLEKLVDTSNQWILERTGIVERHKAAPEQVLSSRDVWKDMAHAIFNLKEFLYLR